MSIHAVVKCLTENGALRPGMRISRASDIDCSPESVRITIFYAMAEFIEEQTLMLGSLSKLAPSSAAVMVLASASDERKGRRGFPRADLWSPD
jgi:hypothetical protein